MALSAAYFVGDLLIPNISGSTVTETANLLQLQIAIAKYEPDFLRRLLGTDFYDLYAAGIAATVPDARWTALKNALYVENTTLDVGFSPAANYVYCKFVKQQNSLTLVHSEAKARHENMELFTPREKYVAAWNDMVRQINIFLVWMEDNSADYPEYSSQDTAPETFEPINPWGI